MLSLNMEILLPFIFGLLTCIAILFGGYVAIKFEKKIKYLIAFCGGTLVASAFIEILPESIHIAGDENLNLMMIITLCNFLFFFILDKIVFIHSHSHDEDHEERINGFNLIPSFGILFHTLLDGLIIGAGFMIDNFTGIILALVILLHDFTDGISTSTVLIRHKVPNKLIKLILFASGIMTMLGIILVQIIPIDEHSFGYIFAAFAGFFIYLGASDLLPEAHKDRTSPKLVLMTLLGAGLVVIFSMFGGH